MYFMEYRECKATIGIAYHDSIYYTFRTEIVSSIVPRYWHEYNYVRFEDPMELLVLGVRWTTGAYIQSICCSSICRQTDLIK